MADLFAELSNEIYDVSDKEAGGLCPMSVFLGILVTLLPKVVPRILPMFLPADAQEASIKRLDDPEYQKEIEDLFREKFSENLEMVEKIIVSMENQSLEKSDPGSQEGFLVGALNALGISDFTEGLQTGSLRRLARIANGEGTGSQVYSLAADVIMFLGELFFSFLA